MDDEVDPSGDAAPTEQQFIDIDLLHSCTVVDRAGNEIGDVEEVMVNVATGAISHLHVSCGSWLDSRVVTLPWSALRLDLVSGNLILERETAEMVPPVDGPGKWSNRSVFAVE